MLHDRLVKALMKANKEVVIEQTQRNHYMATLGKRVLSWYVQEDDGKLHVHCVVKPSPYTDIMTDCFCDTYYHTIKESVAAILRA
jgi:uncharacterized protein (UPF0262 family)